MRHRILILNPPGGELEELVESFRVASGGRYDLKIIDSLDHLRRALFPGGECSLVVTDYEIGDGEKRGIEILKAIRSVDSQIPVVMVAQKGDVESVLEAIQAGATDFLVRGGRLEKRVSTLLGKVARILALVEQNRILGEQNMLLREAARSNYMIVGESPEIQGVIEQIERVAKIPRPILIIGERGTGKELVARAVHEAAGMARKPFVAVNCAAVSDTLLESELFGHEKGAFTGADSLMHGKFEQAAGGTLFLDEIGNMSLSFQQKILRVVEYGVFTRVGGRSEIKADCRVIAATNVNLEERMKEGQFLPDLYDRLAFEVIEVPPLRQREGDVEILSRHFLHEFMREIPSLGGKRLAHSAIRSLRKYGFPGNVRELKNIIERAAYRDTTNEITPRDIGMLGEGDITGEGYGVTFEEKIESFKKRLISQAHEKAGGNQAEAARILGLSYHQFRYYYGRYIKKDDN